jgi:inosine-uridine nucleoside N-ribohydrolase
VKRLAAAAVCAVLLAGCSVGAGPTTPAGSGGPASSPTASPPAARPIVIDTDLGGDDLLAVSLLLADPGVDVRAITVAGTGLVHCDPGLDDLRALLVRLRTPDVPVACGRETAAAPAAPFPDDWRSAADAAYGLALPTVAPLTTPTAAHLLVDTIQASPTPLTVVDLAPWTNLADALALDPSIATRVSGLFAMAGVIDYAGNAYRDGAPIAAAVEANIAADPVSAQAVLDSSIGITLVPLDVTDSIPVPSDIAAQLLPDHRAAAADLALELFAHNPFLAGAANRQYFWDETAAVTFLDPALASWKSRDVMLAISDAAPGQINAAANGRSIRFAATAEPEAITAAILAGLRRGPAAADPISLAGPASFVSDGARCAMTMAGTTPPVGATLLRFENQGGTAAALALVSASAPHTLQDIVDLARDFDLAHDSVPPWISQVAGLNANPGVTSWGFGVIAPPGLVPICAVGDPSAPTLVVGEPVVVAQASVPTTGSASP